EPHARRRREPPERRGRAALPRRRAHLLREVPSRDRRQRHRARIAMSDRRLVARGLNKTLSGRRIVADVDLEVAPGRVVGLLGPNGAGKTTCFKMIAGLLRPDAGTVTLDGTDLGRLP